MSEERSRGQPLTVYKLPSGRHGLSRAHVGENQRWRLLGAAGEVLAEHGYRGTTSHKVAGRAAVSARTFYAHFRNTDECLLAAFEAGARSLRATAEKAREGPGSSPVGEVLARVSRDASFGRLFSLEARAAVPGLVEAFASLVDALASERSLRGRGVDSSLRSRILLGAALGVIADAPAAEPLAIGKLVEQLTRM